MNTGKKRLHWALWGAQIAMGALFCFAGYFKAMTPWDTLVSQAPNVEGLGVNMVRFIGFSEMAGGIGMVLPAAAGFYPFLTPIAGACLSVVMALASGYHLMRAEYSNMGMTATLCAVCAFVAYGRFTLVPFKAAKTTRTTSSGKKRKAA
jgi:hypothetical protein